MVVGDRKWVDGNLYNVKPSVERFLEHLKLRRADRHFVLAWLATLHVHGIQCEIFDKHYMPSPRTSAVKQPLVRSHNEDNFFVNDAQVSQRHLKMRMNIPMTTAQKLKHDKEKLDEEMAKLIETQKRLNVQINQINDEMNQDGTDFYSTCRKIKKRSLKEAFPDEEMKEEPPKCKKRLLTRPDSLKST